MRGFPVQGPGPVSALQTWPPQDGLLTCPDLLPACKQSPAVPRTHRGLTWRSFHGSPNTSSTSPEGQNVSGDSVSWCWAAPAEQEVGAGVPPLKAHSRRWQLSPQASDGEGAPVPSPSSASLL